MSPPWEFPQMSIADCGTCGSHVCTVKHTFRPRARASLVTLCVLSKYLFTSSAAAWNSGGEDERRVTVENLRFSLLSVCLSLSVFPECFNPRAPNTLSCWGPPSPAAGARPTVGPHGWHTAVRSFFGWAPGSQTRPRSWQEHTARRDALLCPRFSTAVQIN